MIDRRIGPIYVRKGTDIERRLFIVDEAEFVYSTDKKRLFIGDNVTKGGILVSNKNYITNTTDTVTIPLYEAMYGDIVYNKMIGITYIIGYDLDGISLKLIPICDLYLCDKLKTKVDALSAKFDTIKDCLINYDIDNNKNRKIIFDTHGQLYFVDQPPAMLEVFEGDSIRISCTVFDTLSVDPPYLPSRQFVQTAQYINGIDKSKNGRVMASVKKFLNTDLYTFNMNINNAKFSDSGTYELIYKQMYKVKSTVSNLIQAITSEPVFVVVKSRKDAPIFVTQPISQKTTALVSKTFSVSAIGTLPINYQWFKDDVEISGATSLNYTENNPTKNVTLVCKASNVGGVTSSIPAVLEVNVLPFIITQPVSVNAKIGDTISLNVVAGGTPVLLYQWYTGNAISKVPIAGANQPTLTISPLAKTDETTYFCEVANDQGSVNSEVVFVKITHPLIGTGEFLPPGTDQKFPIPKGITKIRLKVAGSGGAAVISSGGDVELIDASLVGIKLAGAKVTRGMAGNSKVDMGDSGKISSGGAGFGAFKDNVFGFLAYTTSGGGGGGAVYFKVLTVKDGDVITYTTGIPKGASSVSINGWSAAAGAGGTGLVGGFGRSTGAIVNSTNTGGVSYAANPSGIPNGGSGGVVTGSATDFTFIGKPGGTPTYKGDGVRIDGGDGGKNGYNEDFGGYIFIEYVDDSVTSTTPPPPPFIPTTPITPPTPTTPVAPPSIPFGDVAPFITTQPIASQTIKIGDPVVISIVAKGTEPLSYQWFKDNVAIGGKTTTSLNIAAAVIGDAGIYKCVVTNKLGNATSNNSELLIQKKFDGTTTLPDAACTVDMIKILTAAGWDGKESSLNNFKITISGKIGCCVGNDSPTTPTFNWGTLNVNNFIVDIAIIGKAVLVLGKNEVVPANITITDDTYLAANGATIKGTLTFGGGNSTLGSCPAPTTTTTPATITPSSTITLNTDACHVDMIKVLNDAGWDGKESSLDGLDINITNCKIGCCTGGSTSTTPTFNWGTLDVTKFKVDITLTNSILILGTSEKVPANIFPKTGSTLAGNGTVLGGVNFAGGSISPGCP